MIDIIMICWNGNYLSEAVWIQGQLKELAPKVILEVGLFFCNTKQTALFQPIFIGTSDNYSQSKINTHNAQISPRQKQNQFYIIVQYHNGIQSCLLLTFTVHTVMFP